MKKLFAAASLFVALQAGAIAQTYPTKPLRAILPLTPGGLGDVVLRAVSAELAKSLGESGYRGVQLRAWFGFLAPAGTPKPAINKLHDEIARIAGAVAFKEQYFHRLGLEPILDTPEQFARYLKEDQAKGQKLVKDAGVTAE